MNGQDRIDQRRPCPNHRCHQWNKLDARFCARCGTALANAPARAPATAPGVPHRAFVLIFIGFFLALFVAMLYAVGPLTLLVLPFVGFGLKWGSTHQGCRRRARCV